MLLHVLQVEVLPVVAVAWLALQSQRFVGIFVAILPIISEQLP